VNNKVDLVESTIQTRFEGIKWLVYLQALYKQQFAARASRISML
jgi:hypothetical protein